MYNKGIVVDFLDFFLLFEMRIMDFLRSSCGYDVKKIFCVCFLFNLFLLSSSNLVWKIWFYYGKINVFNRRDFVIDYDSRKWKMFFVVVILVVK